MGSQHFANSLSVVKEVIVSKATRKVITVMSLLIRKHQIYKKKCFSHSKAAMKVENIVNEKAV